MDDKAVPMDEHKSPHLRHYSKFPPFPEFPELDFLVFLTNFLLPFPETSLLILSLEEKHVGGLIISFKISKPF